MMTNMTFLAEEMDKVKTDLDGIEQQLHSEAKSSFEQNDQYMNMDEQEKAEMFDEAMGEFHTSLGILRKKFGIIDKKMEEMGDMTDDMHSSTDKLELLFRKDIEKRKKHFQQE